MLSQLHGLDERWYQAWPGKDAATVERLMADDYIYFAPNGLVLDRQTVLAIIRSPRYRLDHGRRTEVVVRAVGHDAVVVRHRWRGDGSFEGTSFGDDNRCVMVWEKRAGERRLVMDQCSFSSK
jgi:ketosteroid isomerase-like protein